MNTSYTDWEDQAQKLYQATTSHPNLAQAQSSAAMAAKIHVALEFCVTSGKKDIYIQDLDSGQQKYLPYKCYSRQDLQERSLLANQIAQEDREQLLSWSKKHVLAMAAYQAHQATEPSRE